MNEIFLIIISIILFFFGFEIRPWIVKNKPEHLHLVDLMAMAVAITTILVPLISIIASGEIFVGSYFIVLSVLTGYLIIYGFRHAKELKGKSRRVLTGYIVLYAYIFIASGVLMFLFAPFMPNVKL